MVYTGRPQSSVRKRKPRKMKGAVRNVQFVTMPKKRKRPRNIGAGQKSMAGALRQFQLALKNPFSPDALGVRVVDAVCYPTTVSHLRFKTTCTTSAQGTFQCVLLPFLHANVIVTAGSLTGNPGTYVNNTVVGYAATAGTLRGFFTCYRVASWGVRIILTDSNQNAKGTYTVAPVLLSGPVPGESTLSVAAAGTTNILNAFAVPSPTETIASMPGAVAVNAQDLMTRGELVARGLTYLPNAYNMKQVSNTAQVWVGDQSFTPGCGLWKAAGSLMTNVETNDTNDARGQIAYLLSVANAPASTAEFQLEFIYHLEGVPQPSAGVVMTSTPSPAGSTSTIERVLSVMNSAGEYFEMGTQIADRLSTLGTQMYHFRNRGRMLLR